MNGEARVHKMSASCNVNSHHGKWTIQNKKSKVKLVESVVEKHQPQTSTDPIKITSENEHTKNKVNATKIKLEHKLTKKILNLFNH